MSSSQCAFSPEGDEVISRSLDVDSQTRTKDEDLECVYELHRCSEWIKEHNFKRLCLQFPDNLLVDSNRVSTWLESHTETKTFILADTSYGSCCVDDVAAQHYNVDGIIHYGHACLSPTRRYPVLYIYGCRPVNVTDCLEKVSAEIKDKNSKLILLYDAVYLHAIEGIGGALKKAYPNMIISVLSDKDLNVETSAQSCDDSVTSFKKYGRNFTIEGSIEDYVMLYVGIESRTLTNFMMTFNKNTFYTYDPNRNTARLETVNVNRALMKRYCLIERAKDAAIVGIVAGTLGVADFLTIIDRLKKVIKSAGKKSYTFVMGKLNVAKMANFMEIDIFVLVACPENSLIDSTEFYKPIVTPHELEIACNMSREWNCEHQTDFRQLLPGGSSYVEIPDKQELKADVSLVTGGIRLLGTADDERGTDETSLLKTDVRVAVKNTAADYLSSREWQGLEQQLGETPVTKAVDGRRGIATQYSNEPL